MNTCDQYEIALLKRIFKFCVKYKGIALLKRIFKFCVKYKGYLNLKLFNVEKFSL